MRQITGVYWIDWVRKDYYYSSCFQLEKNSNKAHIQDGTLIIPIDFNRSHSSAKDAILGGVRVAVNEIVNMYGMDYPYTDNMDFYNYIKKVRADLTFINPENISNKERMEVLMEKTPTAFASLQLQYVMNHELCRLKLALLVVDNIEAFMDSKAKNSRSRYIAPVIETFKFMYCVQERAESTKWHFNMVIACRHHIWRIMKGNFDDNTPENILLQSYVTTEHSYDLVQPAAVSDIVKAREKTFGVSKKDSVKWNDAVKVVNTVLDKMDNTVGDFVLQLYLKDIRKSMQKMKDLILARGLQQKSEEETYGYFKIDSIDQYDLSRVNLIKVIGMDNRKFYSDASSIIPNLLRNSQGHDIELFLLLTLKYFLRKCSFQEPTWENNISISSFYQEMHDIFGYDDNNFKLRFEDSVYYMLRHRLLLRSADQPQNEVPGLSLDEISKIERVYVSGASVKLWEELSRSSALFQLFLDDIWFDENLSYFDENGNDIEHCMMYINKLYEKERYIYNNPANNSISHERSYIEAFGTTPICKQLLVGVIESLNSIISSADDTLYDKVKSARITLRMAEHLLEELEKWKEERKAALK